MCAVSPVKRGTSLPGFGINVGQALGDGLAPSDEGPADRVPVFVGVAQAKLFIRNLIVGVLLDIKAFLAEINFMACGASNDGAHFHQLIPQILAGFINGVSA